MSGSTQASRFNPYWLLVAPAVLLVLALYVAPIANVLFLSVTDPKPGLGNYYRIFESDTVANLIIRTIRLCLITTVCSVILGYVVAYAMIHALSHVRQRMMAILLISFWISVLVRSFAWMMLLGHNGLVNNTLMASGLISDPLPLMRNEFGVLVGMTEYMVPYAILPLLANMQGIDPQLASASRSLGASRTQTFFRVYLPLTRPGIIAASLLVFITSLGFYVTPAILGGGKVQMIAEYISVQLLVTVRWGTAAMLATLMIASVLAMMYVLNRFMKLSAVFGGARS
jgi:putative spermidine/putrescine transport system permease protein